MTVIEGPARAVAAQRRKVVPVKWWAGFGAVWLAFMAYVLVSWVTGPYFERVPVGPSDPPLYMKVFLMALQVTMLPAMAGLIWWFVVRPWRREGRLSVDGALTLAYGTLFFQDPISNYYGTWITYNSWSFNRGSWVNDLPGWMSFGQPGATIAEPPLTIVGLYVVIMAVAVRLGTATLHWTSGRFPAMGKAGLAGVCFAAMFTFDVIFEGVTFMPLGVWTYAGGHLNVFGDQYHSYPLHEAFLVGILLTAFASLRFSLDDRGQTLVERGADRLEVSEGRRSVIRGLALVGAINAIFLACYTLPNLWVGAHARDFNADVQQRSYFLDGLCGEGTGRSCPPPIDQPERGPIVPFERGG